MMIHSTIKRTLVAILVLVPFVIASVVQAKSPRTEKQISQEQMALLKAVAKGDALWHNPKLGTNGLACGNCHPDGSATNPHTFPKYQTNLGKVGTLREMINWCILVPMQGKMLKLDSDDLIAMEAYATYTHRGVKIDPAKDEQHGAVPVKSGPGYPSK
ncbi:MAG: cytochrome C [Gammaproteobacteria bacterium]|nr:cytochrome C [Gammaproteobacteria bacterium]MDH5802758.1 cytochrome C [Gammaproteobacteria bacterium]